MQWEKHSNTSVIFPPKVHILNLFKREHQTHGTVYKITGPWSSSFNVMKISERLRNYSRLKKAKRAWQWNVISYSSLHLFAMNDSTAVRQLAKLGWDLRMRWKCIHADIPVLMVRLWLYKRMSLFEWNIKKDVDGTCWPLILKWFKREILHKIQATFLWVWDCFRNIF